MSEQPKHVAVVCCLIRNEEDKLLLVKHHIRGWELPQGRVEEGETLIFALSREVLEETGVTISHAKLSVIWSKVSNPAVIIFCFQARYASGQLTPSEETPDVAWCSIDEAFQRIAHPVNRDRFKSILKHEGDVEFRSYQTGPYRILN